MSSTLPTESSSPSALQYPFPANWSVADVQHHLGKIPLERIRVVPPLGCATEEDVINLEVHEDRLCELENGILVEKPMGWYESLLVVLIVTKLNTFVLANDLGKVFGADGTIRILPGIVKIPDVSFISWDRWPKEKLPRRPIPALVPDMVVEVLSETNTQKEMELKLNSYFQAGARLVWYIDPDTRSAKSYTSPTTVTEVATTGQLDGGQVLPGFTLSLKTLFEQADRQGPASFGSPSLFLLRL